MNDPGPPGQAPDGVVLSALGRQRALDLSGVEDHQVRGKLKIGLRLPGRRGRGGSEKE